MKKIIGLLFLSSAIFLNASEPSSIPKNKNADVSAAINDIKKVQEAVKETKASSITKKSESQLEAEIEKKAKKLDREKIVDINIYALRKMRDSIPLSYTFADVEFGTIGTTKFFVYEEVMKRALKDLRENKELRKEITAYLRTVSSSKNIKSDWLLGEKYNLLQSKYSQWSLKGTKLSGAYEYKSNGKRVGYKEGLIANSIYASIIGETVSLKIK